MQGVVLRSKTCFRISKLLLYKKYKSVPEYCVVGTVIEVCFKENSVDDETRKIHIELGDTN